MKQKKLNYASKIQKASNKNKTIWNIVNLESNKTNNTEKITTLNIDGFSTLSWWGGLSVLMTLQAMPAVA